jgi:hypothetical protein
VEACARLRRLFASIEVVEVSLRREVGYHEVIVLEANVEILRRPSGRAQDDRLVASGLDLADLGRSSAAPAQVWR